MTRRDVRPALDYPKELRKASQPEFQYVAICPPRRAGKKKPPA
jgi:hypothetical protein